MMIFAFPEGAIITINEVAPFSTPVAQAKTPIYLSRNEQFKVNLKLYSIERSSIRNYVFTEL